MRIKFKAPDPRAGTVAEMDSHRGQELIDAGAAVQVKDDATSDEPAPAAKKAAATAAPAPTPAPQAAPAAKPAKRGSR